MYLPADDVDARRRVTDAFLAYRDLCKTQLWDRCIGGFSHRTLTYMLTEQNKIQLDSMDITGWRMLVLRNAFGRHPSQGSVLSMTGVLVRLLVLERRLV